MTAPNGRAVRFFDAHCDTIIKIVDEGAGFGAAPRLQVTVPGLHSGRVCAQVFACCVPEARHPGRARERGQHLVEAVRALCLAHSAVLRLAEAPAVLAGVCAAAEPPGATAAIIALEGADPLEGRAEALCDFQRRGVRLLTLAWDDNPFCGAVSGQTGAGLSRQGEALVGLCEDLGVMVDVSHASDAAFWDVCRVATKPFVASHSNCRALCDAPRNLSDRMILALAERGGVLGINLASGFLSQPFRDLARVPSEAFWAAVRAGSLTFDEAGAQAGRALRALPRPSLDLVAAHVKHAIAVGGEDCVGIGGDLDGIDSLPAGIESVADYPKMATLLLRAGLSERQVEKVCWRNFARVFAA